MTLEESSIFINLQSIRRKLYSSQFDMSKADRIIYGTPIMQELGKSLVAFVLAFTVKDKREVYLEESIGHFAVMRIDWEFCVHEHIVHFKARETKIDKETGKRVPCETKEDRVNSEEIEIFRLISAIDDDMCKWLRSLAKVKTICE